MKVLGIGNAIVDVICKVEESFLSENNLTKSTMKLVDEIEFKKLLSNLKIEETKTQQLYTESLIEELRNAFELAERTSPGISDHFAHMIFARLQPGLSDERIQLAVDRLKR